MDELKKSFGELVGLMLLLIISYLSWGFVVFKFYDWFLLSIFEELPIITYYQAIGLYMVVGIFRGYGSSFIKKEYLIDNKERYIWLLTYPWFLILIGLIVK